MAHRELWSRPVAAGLLSAWLLTGCTTGEDRASESDSMELEEEAVDSELPSGEARRSPLGDLFARLRDGGRPRPGFPTRPRTDAGTKPDAGHGEGGHGHGPGGGGGLPCDVSTIVAKYCGTCHGAQPAFGAPMSLLSAADFQAAHDGDAMYAHVKERVNQTDPRGAMPPASSPQLSAPEKAILNAWLDKGAPESSESCEGPAGAEGEEIDTSGLECYRLTAHNGDGKTPYAVGAAKDAYFNFTFTAPWKQTAYGVVVRPVVDNKQVIHHWLLFQDSANNAPTGAVRSSGAHPGGTLLAGWAPGGSSTTLRGNGLDAAIELPANRSYTIEFHYNSSDAQAKDASGVEICVQTKKPQNIVGLSWLGYDLLGTPATQWTGTCKPSSRQPIRILNVIPHMHKTGIHMKATINRANGKKETLHDAPFDFNYQIGYPKDVTLQPGDTITTECTYSQPMKFGESTDAEMCYLFTLAYPKNALSDTGIWGRLAHGAGSCLGQ